MFHKKKMTAEKQLIARLAYLVNLDEDVRNVIVSVNQIREDIKTLHEQSRENIEALDTQMNVLKNMVTTSRILPIEKKAVNKTNISKKSRKD